MPKLRRGFVVGLLAGFVGGNRHQPAGRTNCDARPFSSIAHQAGGAVYADPSKASALARSDPGLLSKNDPGNL